MYFYDHTCAYTHEDIHTRTHTHISGGCSGFHFTSAIRDKLGAITGFMRTYKIDIEVLSDTQKSRLRLSPLASQELSSLYNDCIGE